MPSTQTGGGARSATRSSATRTTAAPPSERMQHWSFVKGSAIIGPDRTSSTVIGSRNDASSFGPALARADTAISASCSSVVPNSCMCRRAAMAYFEISVCPYGTSHCRGPREPQSSEAVRSLLRRSERAVEPYVSNTTSACPWAMASTACAAMTSHAAPPTAVESIHRGRNPRYSLTSIGAIVPSAVDATPSTSSRVSPASASAARLARARSSKGVAGSVPPSATPAIATRLAFTTLPGDR